MSNGMERQKHNNAGESGFYHFYGVIEDRKDPKDLGRVRVRIYSDNTDSLTELPTDELTWAQVILPVTAPPNTQHNLLDGQLVFGYYADGVEKHVPVIMGQMAMNGDTTVDPEGIKVTGFQDQREKKDCVIRDDQEWSSTGINTSPTANPKKWSSSIPKAIRDKTEHKSKFSYKEPTGNYASVYPFNKSSQTESGHIIEYDDTPGAERICISHRAGAYIEMLKDGTVLYKAVKDNHNIANGDTFSATGGSFNRTVGGSVTDEVSSGYDLKISGGNLNINVSGSVNIQAGGSFNVKASSINLN